MTNQKLPPTKETCLQLARYYCETVKDENKMWQWLVIWAAYDDYDWSIT